MKNTFIPLTPIDELYSKKFSTSLKKNLTSITEAKSHDIVAFSISCAVGHMGTEIFGKPSAVFVSDNNVLRASLYDMIRSGTYPLPTMQRMAAIQELFEDDLMEAAEHILRDQGGELGHTPTLNLFLTSDALISLIDEDAPSDEEIEGDSILEDQHEVDTRIRILVPNASTSHEKIARQAGLSSVADTARFMIKHFEKECPEIIDLPIRLEDAD